MKSKIVMSLATIAALGALSQNSFAASKAKVFKTLDGAVTRCGVENSVERSLGSKNVLVELASETASQKNHSTTLKVSLVKCSGSKWALDQDPTTESFMAANGESVEIKFSDFEVMIVDKDYNVVARESLNSIAASGEELISVAIAKNSENPQDLEVIVQAKKSLKTTSGYSSESLERFGSFRLRITK